MHTDEAAMPLRKENANNLRMHTDEAAMPLRKENANNLRMHTDEAAMPLRKENAYMIPRNLFISIIVKNQNH